MNSLLSFIEQYGWAQDVDLINGGHNVLMFTPKEMTKARGDYEGAVKAGIIQPEEENWLDADQTKQVM